MKAHNKITTTKLAKFHLLAIIAITLTTNFAFANNSINHNRGSKTIVIEDAEKKLSMTIDYSQGAKVTKLFVNGESTLSESGIYTGFKTRGGAFYSYKNRGEIKVDESANKITLSNIVYGDDAVRANERWIFELANNKINWTINREYNTLAKLEETAFPQWNFAGLSVWKGGIIDNGGMVWCKYLASQNDTYGVHTGGVTFWNPESGDALRINAKTGNDKFIAARYSHTDKDEFAFIQIGRASCRERV